MHISYEQVTAFVAVAEFGSFSAAAKQLHKHRTTLGQVITNLEIEINMTLFDRSTRYPQLTEASYIMNKLTEPTSITNGMMKLSTAPYRVPADAPYKDFGNGNGMSSYATEWTMTQSLDTGDSVFEYNFEENWNTVKFNVYEMMGKDFRLPLTKSFMAKF